MAKRPLFPTDRIDRLVLILGWIALLLVVPIFWLQIHPYWSPKWYHWAIPVIAMVLLWAITRALSTPSADEFEGYTNAIGQISGIERQLNALVIFLKKEREKVLQSQQTVNSLRNEQTLLEPVVLTQRETVNAILAAHARTTASNVWKERALGFISGILTSLIATFVFEYFRQ